MPEPWENGPDFKQFLNSIIVLAAFLGLIVVLTGAVVNYTPPPSTAFKTPVKSDYVFKPVAKFSGKYFAGKYWGNDQKWRSLGRFQMVAAMAMLEGSKNKNGSLKCFECSANIVHSIINRAHKDKQSLPDHVSSRVYQPVIEPAQYAALKKIVGSTHHKRLSKMAYNRVKGIDKDRVKGATHYLVHPRVMIALQKREPCKYWNWGPFKCGSKPGQNWTGYNAATGRYKNQVLTDQDHTFLAPEGRYVAPNS